MEQKNSTYWKLPKVKQYKRSEVIDALKLGVLENPNMAYKLLLRLIDLQDDDEYKKSEAFVCNGIGVNRFDAPIFTLVYKQLCKSDDPFETFKKYYFMKLRVPLSKYVTQVTSLYSNEEKLEKYMNKIYTKE